MNQVISDLVPYQVMTNTLQTRAVQILEKASSDPKFKENLLNNPIHVLRDSGFVIPQPVEQNLEEFLKSLLNQELRQAPQEMLGADSWKCAGCKIGIASAAAVLIAALIAAGIATAGGVDVAIAACSGAIATFAEAVGLPVAVITGIIGGLTSFTVTTLVIATCQKLGSC